MNITNKTATMSISHAMNVADNPMARHTISMTYSTITVVIQSIIPLVSFIVKAKKSPGT
mgnify:CR=1 FL=1